MSSYNHIMNELALKQSSLRSFSDYMIQIHCPPSNITRPTGQFQRQTTTCAITLSIYCDSCSIFRSLVFRGHICICQARQINLRVICSSARPYLHMLGLPNPTSFECRLICVTPGMYEMSAIWEILPGGAHFGRILVFAFVKGSSYHMLPSCILYQQVLRCLSYGNTKSTVSPFQFVLS